MNRKKKLTAMLSSWTRSVIHPGYEEEHSEDDPFDQNGDALP
jgi:hypothetical protein